MKIVAVRVRTWHEGDMAAVTSSNMLRGVTRIWSSWSTSQSRRSVSGEAAKRGRLRPPMLGGSGGMLPRKILKNRHEIVQFGALLDFFKLIFSPKISLLFI